MNISVIIPVYKVEKYLRRCIESVINQTYKDIEIILINDGSPDSCGEICDDYAQKDIRIKVIHKGNEGVCEARNSGMKIMNGDYIFFLDSDDFINDGALDTLYKRARQTDADIIIGNYNTINEKNMITVGDVLKKDSLNKADLKNSTERFKYFFCKSYGTQVWNKLYKSSFIKATNIIFEKEINFGEDQLFNLKLFINQPKIELVNEYTYYYFENKESISNSYKKNLTEQSLNLVESFYEYTKKQNKSADNQDLIAYLVFTVIDLSMLNIYQYSTGNFKKMKNELKKFKNSEISNNAFKDLAKGKYLRDVPRRDWKYFVRVFSILYNFNFTNIATTIQLLRFKLIN